MTSIISEKIVHAEPVSAYGAYSKKNTTLNPTSFSKVKEKDALDDDRFNFKRTVLSLGKGPKDTTPYIFGTFLYFIVFVILIPHLLITYSRYDILAAYFPNVDMLATILGYDGGRYLFFDDSIWRYLYNPSNFTLMGFISTTLINYTALLGMTFIVAYTTYKTKSWKAGWALAFVMAITTYLAPGNIIVILQNNFGKELAQKHLIERTTTLHYTLVVLFGLLLALSLIFTESKLINYLHSPLVNIMDQSVRYYKLII